ncbi:hypothetical protein SCE1572_01055 [Sorangium cellulosum So0157-2]|uniref:Uncharacterized protein n=1 Tax=Sorangium cellulosum So0157-2 TaxID=1254432 RepID=S4XL61_SORCE|nr:hypothetical protein SCE1572_01055 [Sorangium cellulosum So0157-2]
MSPALLDLKDVTPTGKASRSSVASSSEKAIA